MHQLMICLLAPMVLASGCAMPQMQKQRSKPRAASYPKDNNSLAIKPGSIGGATAVNQAEFKPLFEALEKMERFNACCRAYTVEETYERPGDEPVRTKAGYDASKRPAEEVEFILFRNKPPTEEQKKALAEMAISSYGKKEDSETWVDDLKREIKYGSCQMESDGNILKYTFIGKYRFKYWRYWVASLFIYKFYKTGAKVRIEYEVDAFTGSLVSHTEIFSGGMKVRDVYGARLNLREVRRGFVHVPDSEIPIAATVQLRLMPPGKMADNVETAEITSMKIISDIRKVICYDDRLHVDIGEAKVVDAQTR
jgi:hypothetical protein